MLESIAIPTLIYAIEALHLNKSEIRSLEHTLDRAIYRIIKVSDNENIKVRMQMYGISSIKERYIVKKCNFSKRLTNLMEDGKFSNLEVKFLMHFSRLKTSKNVLIDFSESTI